MHPPWRGDMDAVVDQVEALVTAAPSRTEADRALVTVLSVEARRADCRTRSWARSSAASSGRRTPKRAATVSGDLRRPGPGDPLRARDRRRHRGAPGSPRAPACTSANASGWRGTGSRAPRWRSRAGWPRTAAPGTVLLTRDLTSLVVGSGLAFADRGERELRRRAGAPAHRGADAGRRRDASKGSRGTRRSPVRWRTRSRPLSA